MKYVVIGIDNNPKYTVYKRLVETMWEHFGWRVFWLQSGGEELLKVKITAATFAQVARLYAASWPNIGDSDYLMTSDADMLPLSDYWHMSDTFTTWGRDLTDYHFPMCYLGGYAYQWKQLMGMQDSHTIDAMNRDIRIQQNMWILDQDIATEKINAFGAVRRIDRGVDRSTGYPVGRLDRSAWRFDQRVTYIDCHLPHDFTTNPKSRRNVEQLYDNLRTKYHLRHTLNELC